MPRALSGRIGSGRRYKKYVPKEARVLEKRQNDPVYQSKARERNSRPPILYLPEIATPAL
jgi:hypothetical protein